VLIVVETVAELAVTSLERWLVTVGGPAVVKVASSPGVSVPSSGTIR
jgi:hypothetical protein